MHHSSRMTRGIQNESQADLRSGRYSDGKGNTQRDRPNLKDCSRVSGRPKGAFLLFLLQMSEGGSDSRGKAQDGSTGCMLNDC